MIDAINVATTTFADLAWGPWLLVLLLGGGFAFLVISRFTPFRYLGHAVNIVRGTYNNPDDPGHINHAKALSAALAGTIGMGNIAGVALALTIAGPGAIFWMWVTAIIGMATKFFTCSLAVMYRGRDSAGQLQGGPMYVIREGLPKKYHFLAYWFAGVGMIGCLPALQSNQLIQIFRDLVFVEQGWLAPTTDPVYYNLASGVVLAAITGSIIFGGLQRIASVARQVVPTMSLLYLGAAVIALALNLEQAGAAFQLILRDAFSGEAVAGGSLLSLILYGVRRGAYSNEAGMGTESLAHGAVRTNEPIREGLVAMLGPVVDTLLICTATALVILVSGVWEHPAATGVTLTAAAFGQLLGPLGTVIIFICVLCFAATTIFTYSFYGAQCAGFLLGAHRKHLYRKIYVGFILIAAVLPITAAVSLIDGCFALMAIPTMFSSLMLAPKVKQAAQQYWAKFQTAHT